jgi:hypothetical protein
MCVDRPQSVYFHPISLSLWISANLSKTDLKYFFSFFFLLPASILRHLQHTDLTSVLPDESNNFFSPTLHFKTYFFPNVKSITSGITNFSSDQQHAAPQHQRLVQQKHGS